MSENPYTNKRIEFHILQSFPVTCLNRDDVGAPKSAVVGGVPRARVSSQCWKRAVRMALHDVSGVELGSRTKAISTLIASACKERGASEEQAKSCGDAVSKIFNKDAKKGGDEAADGKADTLLFLSPSDVSRLADAFKENGFAAGKVIPDSKPEKAFAKLLENPKLARSGVLDGLDIALFGRMIAQAPTLDVEAAASFSHAISTHKVTNQIEFFTALDDFAGAQGSAHMGSLEFNAATYYRYVSLDLGQLYQTLGSDEFFAAAITAFVKALYVAVPAARQTTQSGACLWDYAKVFVRRGQGVQLSFATPVRAERDGGFLLPSVAAVKEQLAKKEKLSGSLFGKTAEFEFGERDDFSIDDLIASLVASAKA